jgi:hypothetical protein
MATKKRKSSGTRMKCKPTGNGQVRCCIYPKTGPNKNTAKRCFTKGG